MKKLLTFKKIEGIMKIMDFLKYLENYKKLKEKNYEEF
jgi:hypothetical protein